MSGKTRWLDRRIAAAGPYLTLCLSADDFRAAIAPLKTPAVPRWLNSGAGATTHTFEHHRNGIVCVVCIGDFEGRSPIEVAGLLVHEAVHVWQHYCDEIGEHTPGSEQEAYAIQSIAQELMAEFARRMRRKGTR